MGELNRHAELARLESIERSCIGRFFVALGAIDAQRMQLEELIKKRDPGPTIHRLPVELLVLIFHFTIVRPYYARTHKLDTIGYRRRSLAIVSRHWRDVILDTPILWQDICLASPQDRHTLVLQLKRSQGLLLDVTIINKLEDYSTTDELLHHLRPTTNRWRSLYIYDENSYPSTDSIVHVLSKLEFPSLVDFHIKMYPLDLEYLDLQNLLPRASALKRLKLQQISPADDFLIANPLETLELMFALDDMPQWILSRIPNFSLITLRLQGDAYDWVLEPNSIHFPLLEKLALDIPDPDQFLEAITAPKLQRLELTAYRCPWEAFSRSRSKFSSVYHLILNFGGSIPVDPHNGIALCRVFPNTRHAEFIYMADLLSLIMPMSSPGSPSGSQTPADNWASLETLSVLNSAWDLNHIEEFDLLVQWLQIRHGLGFPKLHIKFKGNSRNPEDISTIRGKLQDCCILEHCLSLSLGQFYTMAGKRSEEVFRIW
ncbi:hypothetical protein M404DRAFT_865784 [Pisolithus tinctorius Marx 270]|uniref:F-box domain-containing protein n=1 Tax=Pisolithus tinctorius Marx 270 TaxID=870435 RepID=A0A0C3NR77_PISTI|nr:hypothetical protein M404DRAFT_865784 [Pisolithus tinctorius Marx 270]